MSNYQTIRTIISQISGQENTIVTPKLFIKLTGDLTTATLLNQIVFYSDKSKRTDGYFYKSYKEWEEELCLTERQVRYSTKKLIKEGLVETSLKKANGAPTVHYKLDYNKLVESILTNCQNPSLQNVGIHSDKTSESLTENTTEITTENTTLKRSSRHKYETCDMNAAKYLFEKIKENNLKQKEPSSFDSWANNVRLMRERDNRTLQEIKDVIDWCQNDSFWKSNILSTAKLRQQFDQLYMKMNETGDNYAKNRGRDEGFNGKGKSDGRKNSGTGEDFWSKPAADRGYGYRMS